MLKYSLVLLATAAIISGCDGECCSSGADPIAPVANISGFGDNFQCTAGSTFNVTDSSTDADDNIDTSKTTWTPASIGDAGTIACPAAGEEQKICLTVTDDDGKTSTDCKTLKGPAVVVSTLKDPIIDLNVTSFGPDGFTIRCPKINDQDQVDTDGAENTYGTDKAIKEIHWLVEYPDDVNTTWTQTDFNAANPADYPLGTCGKWVGYSDPRPTVYGEIKVSATPVDDEDDNKTYVFKFDFQNGSVTKK